MVDSKKATFARTFLRGAARSYVFSLSKEKKENWTNLQKELLVEYGKQEGDISYVKEFSNRIQKKGESIQSFGRTLEGLCSKAYPLLDLNGKNSILVSSFIKGLLDVGMCARVQDYIKAHPRVVTVKGVSTTHLPLFEDLLSVSKSYYTHWNENVDGLASSFGAMKLYNIPGVDDGLEGNDVKNEQQVNFTNRRETHYFNKKIERKW